MFLNNKFWNAVSYFLVKTPPIFIISLKSFLLANVQCSPPRGEEAAGCWPSYWAQQGAQWLMDFNCNISCLQSIQFVIWIYLFKCIEGVLDTRDWRPEVREHEVEMWLWETAPRQNCDTWWLIRGSESAGWEEARRWGHGLWLVRLRHPGPLIGWYRVSGRGH